MPKPHQDLKLTTDEIAAAFADPYWQAKFPPVMTLEQSAELLQIPPGTIYQWSSRGLLQGCAAPVGKYVRIFRDRLMIVIFNQGLMSA